MHYCFDSPEWVIFRHVEEVFNRIQMPNRQSTHKHGSCCNRRKFHYRDEEVIIEHIYGVLGITSRSANVYLVLKKTIVSFSKNVWIKIRCRATISTLIRCWVTRLFGIWSGCKILWDQSLLMFYLSLNNYSMIFKKFRLTITTLTRYWVTIKDTF